jgi:hypothetical protein
MKYLSFLNLKFTGFIFKAISSSFLVHQYDTPISQSICHLIKVFSLVTLGVNITKSGANSKIFLEDRPNDIYFNQIHPNISEFIPGDDEELREARSYYSRAVTLISTSQDTKQALTYYKKALEIIEKKFGKENLIYGKILSDLGVCYLIQGENRVALEMFLVSLSLKKKILGEYHEEIYLAYVNLSALYQRVRDFPKAIDALKQACVINEHLKGRNHIDTIKCDIQLANLYMAGGERIFAVIALENCHKRLIRTLGEDHPYTQQIKSQWKFYQKH